MELFRVSFMDKNSSLLEEILSKDPGMTVMIMKKKIGNNWMIYTAQPRYTHLNFFIPYTVSI